MGAMHAWPHMPLLTELDGFVVRVVAIDMPLLTELDNPRRPSSVRSAMSIADGSPVASKLR